VKQQREFIMEKKTYAVLTGDIVKLLNLSVGQLKKLLVRLKMLKNIGNNTDIDRVSVNMPIF
jgi:hypothetical protein